MSGVLWAGFRDLVAEGAAELARLKIDAPDGVALFDHKTTASIGRYAKGPAQLADDLQCNLYALATMIEIDRHSIPARWVYYETKAVRRALPVDVTIFRARAEEIIGKAGELTRTLDAIERSVDAPQNVNACTDYGGCPYHVTAGGPCDARRPIGQLIALRKGKSMALTEDQKQKFAAFRKTPPTDGAGDAPEAETAEAGEPPPGQMSLPGVAPANGAAAPRPRGRPRKLAVVPPPPPPPGSLAEIIGKAQAEIAEAEQVIASATAQRDEAIASLRAALG